MKNTTTDENDHATTAAPESTSRPARRKQKKVKTVKHRPKPAARRGTKKAAVLAMLRKAEGATLAEIIAYASHCTSLGRCEGFSLTKGLFDNLTPLPFCGGLGPGFS